MARKKAGETAGAPEIMPAEMSGTEFVFFQTEDGRTRVQVRMEDNTVWLPQRLLADLYQKDVRTINEHIQNIYDERELAPEATIRKFRIVQREGARDVERLVDHYNLDMILAVGYRVRSLRGTQFRQWATTQLKELLTKGFVLDDERLKAGRTLGDDHFEELLERIRDIRASERLFYQKITDLYAQCSEDYDPKADITQTFYATVQNKLHWAIHGHTAAEVIQERADADKPHMGLMIWKNAPAGRIRKADVSVAKNYLDQDELSELNRVVNMYLDYAEDQARKRKPMFMQDWVQKLDAFLAFNEREVLKDAGRISAEVAKRLAETEFEKYQEKLRIKEATEPTSDFDKVVEEVNRLERKK